MKTFITINQLSELLKIKKSTVYSWVYQRKIPYIKVGRLVRFDLSEIEIWIKDNTVEQYKYK